ncbi:MAG: hypothetical protein KGO49_11280 [Gammaproteobacteria bacterium]|nr:hypothetical protein [Gammaproteobacteria bacterium]
MQSIGQPKRKSSYKFAAIFFGIALVGQSMLFKPRDNQYIAAAQLWIPTQATIQTESMQFFERKRHRIESCLNTTVTYSFQNKDYQSKLYAECKMTTQKLDTTQIETQLRQAYPLQSQISIRINPQQPTQTMTTRNFNRFTDPNQNGMQISKGFEIVGIISIALGLVGFFL